MNICFVTNSIAPNKANRFEIEFISRRYFQRFTSDEFVEDAFNYGQEFSFVLQIN